ncbi:formylglycine-generating enzyme family protein [Fulvivirgaceae bacterium BMA10]|uniref:Formylglycine-generating enzyme family protein n=1 Tax=Splendidivirga corallicola TaxID=3051826 RepID=A0ABT8KLW6_9BACT|nr:formylglycine-generating enzyme family protein [Fulvivirgaceae bacterium BMA10]
MKTFLLSLMVIGSASFAVNATDLIVENVVVTNLGGTTGGYYLTFTVHWKNAWRNKKNHDAAWIFAKYATQFGSRHANLLTNDWKLLAKHPQNIPDPGVDIVAEGTGLFVYPKIEYRGDVSYRIRVSMDTEKAQRINRSTTRINVHGIEMVYIPEGSFTLGDPDTTALHFNSFYKSNDNGDPDGLMQISSENQEIKLGKEKGDLCFRSNIAIYNGIPEGTVPATFPKGVAPFYIMKYEITQGQYAAFLNGIGKNATYFRANFGGKDYYQGRGSIKLKEGKYIALSPKRPLNFVSWEDGLAYADWVGLRPMTELEFTKACRGPGKPQSHEYPWNTSDKSKIARIVDLDDDIKMINGWTENQLTDNNRAVFGASYYWVMDLAGSVWEKTITIGHPKGRAFRGSHGDGQITSNGDATNEDWPRGNNEEGGYGYRGGGYYEHHKPEGEFNPHSPIAYRRFGSWAGGPRSIAYGFRCVRTATK